MPQEEYKTIQITEEHRAAPITDTAYNIFIQGNKLSFWSKGALHTLDRFLPPGSWKFLFTTKEATEEQRAFVAGLPFTDIVHGYTRDLFNNFLRSKGLNPNNNYAVIQNNING